jgi:hypothetical protein
MRRKLSAEKDKRSWEGEKINNLRRWEGAGGFYFELRYIARGSGESIVILHLYNQGLDLGYTVKKVSDFPVVSRDVTN